MNMRNAVSQEYEPGIVKSSCQKKISVRSKVTIFFLYLFFVIDDIVGVR